MTPTEFLTARYDERERDARAIEGARYFHGVDADVEAEVLRLSDPDFVLADIAAQRAILAVHSSWPVLVETRPEFDASSDLANMSMRVSQQMVWLTTQEYRKRFGDDPPTSPIVRAMLQPFADHPDFDPAWRS